MKKLQKRLAKKACKKVAEKYKILLTNHSLIDIIIIVVEGIHSLAAVAQSVERRIGSAEVTGPIPVSSFRKP